MVIGWVRQVGKTTSATSVFVWLLPINYRGHVYPPFYDSIIGPQAGKAGEFVSTQWWN